MSGSKDGSVIVWDLRNGQQVLAIAAHSGAVNSVALTPDGKLIVSASVDQHVRVCDVGEQRRDRVLDGQGSPVKATVFRLSDNGSHVHGAVRGNGRVVDVGSRKRRFDVLYPTEEVELLSCAMPMDERTIIAGGRTGRLYRIAIEGLKPSG